MPYLPNLSAIELEWIIQFAVCLVICGYVLYQAWLSWRVSEVESAGAWSRRRLYAVGYLARVAVKSVAVLIFLAVGVMMGFTPEPVRESVQTATDLAAVLFMAAGWCITGSVAIDGLVQWMLLSLPFPEDVRAVDSMAARVEDA
jgi:hypothetical protein